MEYQTIKNNQTTPLTSIPVLAYEDFLAQNTSLLADQRYHCVSYHGVPQGIK
ncbi:MAG: hypothetical protein IPM82_18780 [Saprospiraceae bacterium]|nr:hypothetical protein [Saprospiraceae bacterium]